MAKKSTVKVTFWGVRGSYPQCNPAYSQVGGDTSCVSLETADHYLIFDAGTGLIEAGEEILRRGLRKATLLISHPHADHISGLAFFKPLHLEDFKLTIIAGQTDSSRNPAGGIESVLERVISPPYFPIPWNKISCQKRCIDVLVGTSFSLEGVTISTISLNHPGGSCGYRVEKGGISVCYITDIAHEAGTIDANLTSFVHRTNLLVYDATFTESEFAARLTWGHSTWNQGVALAKAGTIGELALFHHHPEHNDIFMNHIENQAQAQFSATFVARQGMLWSA